MAETLLQLRSPNYASTKVVAPTGGYTAGQLYASGSLVGVPVQTVDAAAVVAFIYAADKIVVPKVAATGKALTVGQKVYFKSASNAVTGDSTSNTLCGRCIVAAAALADTVEIHLTGNVVA